MGAHPYLVVHLELAQGAVLVHGLDDAHHAGAGDEVGLDVEALQRLVLRQHLGHRLREPGITSGCHPGLAAPPTPCGPAAGARPPKARLAGAGWELGEGDHISGDVGTWRVTGLGLTVATGSLLRVATRLSFLTWVLVFMASQMAFSVEMGMSCREGTGASPRRGEHPRDDAGGTGGVWMSPRAQGPP